MFALVWAQVLRRGSRSLAMVLGLLVACAGYTLLTSQTRSSSLEVRGTVASNARSAYDILVRPKGAQLPLEKQDGLVQAGFLTGLHGGISLKQWHQIEGIPGVDVAAPVAVVGYVMPKVQVPIDPNRADEGSPRRVLLRGEQTWHWDNGASSEVARPGFVYVSPHLSTSGAGPTAVSSEVGADGKQHEVCKGAAGAVPLTVGRPPTIAECESRDAYLKLGQYSQWGTDPIFPLPFLVEAIDPASEAKLAGLRRAMVSGTYLKPSPSHFRKTSFGRARVVPVMVASRPVTRLSVSYRLERLPSSAAAAVSNGSAPDMESRAPGRVIASGSIGEGAVYRALLRSMATPTSDGDYFATQYSYLYTTGPTSYDVRGPSAGRKLHVKVAHNKSSVWAGDEGDVLGSLIPPGADDTAFRVMNGYQWANGSSDNVTPVFVKMGTFDPSNLPGQSALTRVPLGTYAPTVLTAATTHGRKLLRNKPLPPSSNVAGYVQPPPLMLTTLDALPAFEVGIGTWRKLDGDRAGAPAAPVDRARPISSIRIRVAGVFGVDATSRERVRLVAQQIEDQTGLLVDITVGSSPAPQDILLPAAHHGRPELALTENWVKKGVAVMLLTAVSKKSAALFLLVLLVCGLFVANAAAASVRARRSELGVLACLGWPVLRIFAVVLGELAVIAIAAGVGGGIVAWGAGAAMGFPVSPQRAALALPAALVVALAAGMIPAWRAAHTSPIEAVHAPVVMARRGSEPRTVAQLGVVNVRRSRGRSALAAAGLAVAVAALVVVSGIVSGFRGAVVGTLLGNAVSVQVRGADYAAVAAIVLLAGVGVVNVLFLSIRERGSEIATLRAVGWDEGALAMLFMVEGVAIGAAGSIVGAVAGVLTLVALLGELSVTVVVTIVIASIVGVLVALLASIVPVLSLRRLPTAQLLSEE